MTLCFVVACTVLSGGCGPATSVSNESVQYVAKYVCCSQRGSAGLQYVSDAALSRVTLPALIRANKELNAVVLRGDAEGYTDLDNVDEILEYL